MPRKTKVVSHLNTLNEKRYATTTVNESDGSGSSVEDEEMETNSNNMADDEAVGFQDKISMENIADVFGKWLSLRLIPDQNMIFFFRYYRVVQS